MAVTKKTSVVSRLSCVAVALPGINSQAIASGADGLVTTDFQTAHYQESDNRIKVDVYEASLSMPVPVGKDTTFNLGLIKDTISGASPMFTIKDAATGKPKQVLSGASVQDERNVVNLALSTLMAGNTLSVSAGLSNEDDYLSKYMQLGWSRDYNKKMTTIASSINFSNDTITPTGRNYTEKKKLQQLSFGVTQIIDANSLYSSNITYANIDGFLTDPYKLVYFASGGILQENRPDARNNFAWLHRYIRNFNSFNHAALHFDYRFFKDNWGIDSHMIEANWHQPFGNGWQIIPKLRYYTQNAANFYQPYFETTGATHYSSDYRLAGFGAWTFGVNLTKEIHQQNSRSKLHFRLGAEYYDRRASYKLGSSNNDDSGDYNFYLISAAIKYSF